MACGLLVAGVALISAAAVAVFGHKTNDLIATVATVLPGAHTDDNAPIFSGKLIETDTVGPANSGATASIALDADTIESNSGTSRLEDNLGFASGTLGDLVVD